MSNRTFDALRFLAERGLPAVVVLLIALGEIWGWSIMTPLSLTVGAVNVFIGTLVGVTRNK